MRRRRGWIAGAATSLVLLALLFVFAPVTLLGPGTVVAGGRALASDEVRFVVTEPVAPPRSERVALGAAPDGAEPVEPAESASEPESVPVVTPSEATLVGSLRSDDPTFIGSFEVALMTANGARERRQEVELDRTFRFERLEPGPHRLEIRDPRPETRWWFEGLTFHVHEPYQATLSARELLLRPGETRVDVVLGRDPLESCHVIGWLVGMRDEPDTSYRVDVVDRHFGVAADGSFDAGFLPPMGAFLNVMCRVEELEAERDELTSWFLVASEHLTDLPAGGMRTVQIDLPSVSFVTVDVRELGSRRPLADAYVTFRSLGRFGTGRSSLGSPSTVLLPEGSYIVLVTVKNHQWGFRRLEVGAGDGDVVLEVDLSRADEHLVRISDEAGAPFAKAVVSVRHWEGMTIGAYIANGGRPLLTNASGFVDLGFLPDEAFGLSVRSDDRVYEAVLEPGIGELVLEREGGWPVQHVESGSR